MVTPCAAAQREESAAHTDGKRRNSAAHGAAEKDGGGRGAHPPERETPQGRPREPPAEERERQKRLATGGTAWGDRGRGTERGERRSESKPQRRTTAPD